MTTKLVPLLAKIKTKGLSNALPRDLIDSTRCRARGYGEPPDTVHIVALQRYQMATLGVHEAMGAKVDREAIATLVLPQLWAMSMGPCRFSPILIDLSDPRYYSAERRSIQSLHDVSGVDDDVPLKCWLMVATVQGDQISRSPRRARA